MLNSTPIARSQKYSMIILWILLKKFNTGRTKFLSLLQTYEHHYTHIFCNLEFICMTSLLYQFVFFDTNADRCFSVHIVLWL